MLSALPASQARAQALRRLPERFMRAEMPPLAARPADLAELKQQVAADLAPFDAIHVLACLVATAGIFTRKEIYSELNDDSAAPVEYVASILLERETRDPVCEPGPLSAMSSAIQRTLDRTRGVTMQRIVAGRAQEMRAKTSLDAIAATVEVYDAISRWPGYADQARALLVEVADNRDVAAFLTRDAGFDISQALELEGAVGRLLTEQFNAHGERTANTVNNRQDELDANPETAPHDLKATGAKARAARGRWLIAQEYFSERLTEALLVSASDLAFEAGVDESVAESFLRAFSMSFGDTKGTTILTGRNLVRQRPFIAAGEGRYLLTFPGNLLWGIRPLVERLAKDNQDIFDTYEAVRSSYTEQRTAAHFRMALKTDQVWTNLWYWLDGKRYEADVLACIDNLCVVVEVKSGDFSDRAWRGRTGNLRRDLDALLGKSSEQCGRLARELQDGRTPDFIDRDTRQPVKLPLDQIERVEAVVVTLESLGFVGLSFPHLRAAGLLGENEPPWTVSLYDLEAVAKCSAYTPQLTSYIGRRRELDDRVAFMDECDLWMLHLRETLDVSLVRGRSILVDGRSDDLNKAWMFGDRQPTMKLDKASKRRLRELDRKRPPGFLDAGEAVIRDLQRGRRPDVRAFE